MSVIFHSIAYFGRWLDDETDAGHCPILISNQKIKTGYLSGC
jgi:hypothetical protein